MKYTVTIRRIRGKSTQNETITVEAERYERDGRTYTFFRGNTPIATYENVQEVVGDIGQPN
jgi:hypothetical protein